MDKSKIQRVGVQIQWIGVKCSGDILLDFGLIIMGYWVESQSKVQPQVDNHLELDNLQGDNHSHRLHTWKLHSEVGVLSGHKCFLVSFRNYVS